MGKMMKKIAVVALIGSVVVLIVFIGGVLTFDALPDWAVDGHAIQSFRGAYWR